MDDANFSLGNLKLSSRLIMGTGKYPSLEMMQAAHKSSGTQMVTVAMRRIDIGLSASPILNSIDPEIVLLPNTSGCGSAKEVLRVARLAATLNQKFLKIEVIADVKTLLPDPTETLAALKLLRSHAEFDHFILMVYTNDDPVLADQLYNAGADCVMPGGSPIGSGDGIRNPRNLMMILESLSGKVPLILDAGIATPSQAAFAMELGFDAVLLNSAVSGAKNPILMAEAMKLAVQAGRNGFLAGRISAKLYATASSPIEKK